MFFLGYSIHIVVKMDMLECNMKTHADKALFKTILSSEISITAFSAHATVHCS